MVGISSSTTIIESSWSLSSRSRLSILLYTRESVTLISSYYIEESFIDVFINSSSWFIMGRIGLLLSLHKWLLLSWVNKSKDYYWWLVIKCFDPPSLLFLVSLSVVINLEILRLTNSWSRYLLESNYGALRKFGLFIPGTIIGMTESVLLIFDDI